MSKLIVQITPDPITGNPREAEVFKLEFNADWEIDIYIDIYEKNNQGQRLFDTAKTLPGQQGEAAQIKTFPIRRRYTTIGSKVNAQGQVDEQGAINEIDFLNTITFEQFKGILLKTDQDSVLGSIKQFVGAKVQEISQRGQN
ncbi:MAG: hypothetical protein ACK5OS_02650 [Chryseotalea sp.]|jgi:hypothetical protein